MRAPAANAGLVTASPPGDCDCDCDAVVEGDVASAVVDGDTVVSDFDPELEHPPARPARAAAAVMARAAALTALVTAPLSVRQPRTRGSGSPCCRRCACG